MPVAYRVSKDDPRVLSLVKSGVSFEAVAAMMYELRDIIVAFAPELLPRPDPEPKGNA